MNILNNKQYEICKNCFYDLIDTQNKYQSVYNILNYQIPRKQYIKFCEIYNEMFANIEEKEIYNKIKNKNNKYDIIKNKYKDAFIMYLKDEDTEEYYNELATQQRISPITAKRYPFHYYEKYATEEEQDIFDKIKLEKKEKKSKEKEIRTKEKYKDIFNICVESKFDNKEIDSLTKKYLVTPKTIKNYTNNYYDKYANNEEKEKYQQAKNSARYVTIFNDILKMDKIEDILLYLISKKGLNRTYLKTSINPYIATYPNVDKEKLNKIVDKYYDYIEYRNLKEEFEKNKKQEQLKNNINKIEKQKKLILELINIIDKYNKSNNLDYIKYCKDNKISLKKFSIALKICKKIDKQNYQKFTSKIKKNNQKKYKEETKIIYTIINNIKKNEKFNLLDYYLITKKSLNELNNIALKICKKEEYLLFKEFYEKYKNDEQINPSLLIKASYLINSYGNQVELEKTKKEKIIKTLKNQNIPITRNTYLEMIKLELEEKPKQKKKIA